MAHRRSQQESHLCRAWPAIVIVALAVGPIAAVAVHSKPSPAPPAEPCREVVVVDSIAYVGQSPGLVILDVSDPAAPSELGRLALPGVTLGLAVQDGLVLVAGGSRGMYLVDAVDPGAPNLIQLYRTPGAVRRVARKGSHAYLGVGSEGMKIVDVSKPERPLTAGSVRTRGELRALALDGDRLATAEGDGGVRLFDLRNPGDPREVAWFATAVGARDVALKDDLVLVAAGPAGLLVYRTGQETRAEPLGVYAPEGLSAIGVTSYGSRALVAAGSKGLRIVDLTDPARPSTLGSLRVHRSTATLDVAVFGTSAFVAAGDLGMAVVAIGDPANPELVWPRRREFKVEFPSNVGGR